MSVASKYFLTTLLTALLAVSVICSPVAGADSKIDSLANQILRDNLEMQLWTTKLHTLAAVPDRHRRRRAWIWDTSNAVATEVGLVGATALFFSHSNDQTSESTAVKRTNMGLVVQTERRKVRNHVPADKVAATIIPQIAGQGVGGLGALNELIQDVRRDRKLYRRGVGRKTLTKNILLNLSEIEHLQKEYDLRIEEIQSNEPADLIAVYRSESRLLRALVRHTVDEFERVAKRSAQLRNGNYIEDSLGFARNTVGIVGNALNVASVYRNNKRLNGQGAILNMVSGSILTIRPFLSSIGTAVASKPWLRKNLNEAPPELMTIKEQSDLLESMTVGADALAEPILKDRTQIFRMELAQQKEDNSLAQAESKLLAQSVERRYRESIYGPTKIVQSGLTEVIGFRKQNNTTADNRLGATANLTYCSGQVFNILELVRERLMDNAEFRRSESAKMLPEQRLARSALNLQSIRTLIPSSAPGHGNEL